VVTIIIYYNLYAKGSKLFLFVCEQPTNKTNSFKS